MVPPRDPLWFAPYSDQSLPDRGVSMHRLATLAVLALALVAAAPAHAQSGDDPYGDEAHAKVVGGTEASLAHWPWQAELRSHNAGRNLSLYFCGGTAIAPHWLLTAAHCLASQDETGSLTLGFAVPGTGEMVSGVVEAVLGTSDLRTVGNANVYAVDRVVIHPVYAAAYKAARASGRSVSDAITRASMEAGHDLALVHLARTWEGALAPLVLDAAVPLGDTASIAGFGSKITDVLHSLGRYEQTGAARRQVFFAGSDRLMDARLPLVSAEACRSQYASYANAYGKHPYATALISTGQLCAGLPQGSIDTCQGDSGGPLAIRDGKGGHVQIGVVSWGHGCAQEGFPGIYSRLATDREWLRGTMDEPATAVAVADLPAGAEGVAKPFVTAALAQLEGVLGPARGRVETMVERRDAGAAKGFAPVADPGRPVVRVRLGEEYRFTATSAVAGRLVLIDVDANGAVRQILPNGFTPSDSVAKLAAGTAVSVPAADGSWGFDAFRADPPPGKGKLIALVVPDDFPAEALVATKRQLESSKGFEPVKHTSYLMGLIGQILGYLGKMKAAGASSGTMEGWGYAVMDYEIES